MAALPWMARFQRRSEEVAFRCVRAHGVLTEAAERLAVPMPIADVRGVRALIELLRNLLTGVSDDLALAASSMEAAKIVARHGAADSPRHPLFSIQHIPDEHHAVRLATSLFEGARSYIQLACEEVEITCCVHLRAAEHLLAVPTLPALDSDHGILDEEHTIALHGVVVALNLARVIAALAITAQWLVS